MGSRTNQVEADRKLRAGVSILTRGGPVTYYEPQKLIPVLLHGTELPAEAVFEFKNPIDKSHSFVNKPVSVELFFGGNGWEDEDVSLGVFQLDDILPYQSSITLKLSVNPDQLLCLEILDPAISRYRNIGFIELSTLEVPALVPRTEKKSLGELSKAAYEEISQLFLDPKPRDTGIPRSGKDISQSLTVSFEEALYGTQKEIEADSTQTCPACGGSGVRDGKSPVHCTDCQGTGWKKVEKQTPKGAQWQANVCPTCKGNGLLITDPCSSCQGNSWVKTTHPLRLQIPAVIDPGAEICILHQGEPGLWGGRKGHLRIVIDVSAHPLFTRIGRDISIHLPVSANLAKQGGQLHVPAVEKGRYFVLILPANSKNDMTFKIFDCEAYTLSARIDTYQPALLFAFPGIKQRIQAIKDWLGSGSYEIPL